MPKYIYELERSGYTNLMLWRTDSETGETWRFSGNWLVWQTAWEKYPKPLSGSKYMAVIPEEVALFFTENKGA